MSHDISVPFESGSAGFTIHINSLPDATARERLLAHCRVRKYDSRSDAWYGLLLAPGSAAIRGALVIEEDWVTEPEMDNILKEWPRKSMTPLAALSSSGRKRKIGRNELCPCGSGKKYKKCCHAAGIKPG
jgi:hypothetical protein